MKSGHPNKNRMSSDTRSVTDLTITLNRDSNLKLSTFTHLVLIYTAIYLLYLHSGEFPESGFPVTDGEVIDMVLASSSHFCSSGFSLHMFLKLRFRASNREIVV